MKILVAGGSGVVGRRLVPLLVGKGHKVAALTRSAAKAGSVHSLGAEPVIADALEPSHVMRAIQRFQPDVIIHQLTAISHHLDLSRYDQEFAETNRLRTEGTDNLLAGARAAGVRRFIAQSFAGWPYAREGAPVKKEGDRFDPSPPPAFRRTLDALRYLEAKVMGEKSMEGVILRYGFFYGPGTAFGKDGALIEDIRQRRVPIIGGGEGIWSFIHIDDVARITLAAVEQGAPGIYNIVDDDPAPVSEWLPALAAILGAPPPRHVPTWMARLLIGDAFILMTEARGASNAKAKKTFGELLLWPSWREGFKNEFADSQPARDCQKPTIAMPSAAI
jgi:2-alkyl-3-oxoalkanoate reductase